MSLTKHKYRILNRKRQSLVVLIEKNKEKKPRNTILFKPNEQNSKRTVFVMHGLGGFKEQLHIRAFAQAFLDKKFIVVTFDTTNTLGESDGAYEDATVTNYYKDLEDIITWAKKQPWYQAPFYLVGHSLGGLCIMLYALKHPKEVKALAPISTVVSGKLSLQAYQKHDSKTLKRWKKEKILISESASRPGVVKRLKWSHMKDRLKYDLLPHARTLKMPILLIVGEKDTLEPKKHTTLLYHKLSGKKEIHLIKNAPHTFTDKNNLDKIKKIIKKWIEKTL